METKPNRAVIVGAGLAGSTAAARAAQLGRDVLLIDRAPDPSAGGNTALSGGGVHVLRQHLLADTEFLRDRLLGQGWGHARHALIDAFLAAAPHAHHWVTTRGVEFEPASAGSPDDLVPANTHFAPRRDMTDLHAWPDRGPQRALRRLQAEATAAGADVRGSVTARSLSFGADGRIDGVLTDDGHWLAAGAVLLADGGFHASPELRRRFIGPRADRMFVRGSSAAQGSGLRMAEAAGAALANTDWIYGHVLHRDVLHNDRLWPWPTLDTLILSGGILVDEYGRRFTDEGRGGIHAANAMGWCDDPSGAWVIVDAGLWERSRAAPDHLPANPELAVRGARILRAANVRALADEAGIAADGLERTVLEYNAAAESGTAARLPVLRSLNAVPLTGELIALPAVAGITFTMGGPVIDAQARVLHRDGSAIPGLFAAGATAAGPTAGYIGGLATALVFGYIAGTSLAET